MAARVIHFGGDNCYRVQVLRSAGYEVREPASLDGLALDLQTDEGVVAVMLSEGDPKSAESTVELVRKKSTAPVILFRRTQELLDESKFDRVFPWLEEPKVWLAETAQLIQAVPNTGKRRAESSTRSSFRRRK